MRLCLNPERGFFSKLLARTQEKGISPYQWLFSSACLTASVAALRPE